MHCLDRLDQLRAFGKMQWLGPAEGWRAEPEDVLSALEEDGLEECKRQVARSRREGGASGGVWQGLDRRTGAVASVIWVRRATTHECTVFIEIDGTPYRP